MNWKTKVTEISNNVYKLTMIHKHGARIESTGIDIEALKKEAIAGSIRMDEEIERKIKLKNSIQSSDNNPFSIL